MDLKKNIKSEDCFVLALNYYNKLIKNNIELDEELPVGKTFDNILVRNKSISLILEHTIIQTPSIEVCLDLHTEDSSTLLGSYQLIIDTKHKFIDEYLILK